MTGILSKPIDKNCYEILHYWDENCWMATLKMAYYSYRYCLKLYTPFYFLTSLLTRKKKQYFMKKIFLEIMRSSAFLSANAFLIVQSYCICWRVFGKFYYLTSGILPGTMASFGAIMIERKSRRTALASYMFSQALDIAYTIIKSAGLEGYSHYIEASLLSLSMGILFYLHRMDVLPKGYVKSTFNYFFAMQNHAHNQWISLLKGTCKAFGFAYITQTAYHLLIATLKIFRNPELIPLSFIKKANFESGAFFGSMIGIIRLMEVIFSKFTKSSSRYIVAGACASISLMFQRSPYIIIYIFSKMCELVYFSGLEQGYFPYFKHFDAVLYAICTGFMIHSAIMNPSNLRPAYWKFLLNLTNQKLKYTQRECFKIYGYNSDWIYEKDKTQEGNNKEEKIYDK